ncbi:long chain acyl-CoA synthetase 4-like [Ananas comosus]|uniref:Long-chain-fatty-acid--CoA ligase n=1 Tax=Ananas comosus TaxID=4615 RepID=A0A6P5FWV5_ANACO|nr:long chain acyl-CoA synthetase 4-like [Ananas comosus]
MKHLVEVEKAKVGGGRTAGPAYRSVFAKDGFPPPIPGLDSCWDIFRISVERNPKNRMLGRRRVVDGKPCEYEWLSYKQVYDIVMRVGASIRSCGVEQGGRCGIYGANCPEWIISMEACNAHGIYCVPLYDTLGAGAVEFIICHAEIQIAFVEEKKIVEVLKTFPTTTKLLKTIVSFGKITLQQKEEVEKHGLSIYSWDEFLLLGENLQFYLPKTKKTDICTIMYTSGTTGDPKGVLISNESIITLIAGVDRNLHCVNEQTGDDDVYLSYLPLAHIFDRVMEELFIFNGASIGFWRGDVKLLFEDIAALKPTVLSAVPRVLDRIYSGMQSKISTGGFLKKTLFNLAYKYKLHNMRKGSKQDEAAPLIDKLIFNKIKQGLGGNLRLILSGAAPLAANVETYLRVVTCAHVVQGYGLTETCAGTFVSLPNDLSMIGTVGPPVPNVDVRLESVPEMEYDALAAVPRGEICVRGKTLFSGYHKREDLTNEVMIDGWFHTGDIGEWQPDGCLKIIDRKKNIFKLSQGEYVAVENLENIYGLLPEIDMIWIYGNSFESFLVAVVNPNQQALEHWAEQNGVSGDFSTLCENPKAKEYILGELTKTAKANKLKGFEFVKAVHLDPVPFDMERDLLTPTYKKKRPQLLKYYQGAINGLYKATK